jgi:mannose-1-phosphate guanylyltransferase
MSLIDAARYPEISSPQEVVLNEHLYAVIMAGGIGSRLWPRSRSTSPKQFLDLLGSRTMIQETIDRIQPLVPLERVLVVLSEEHAPTVQAQVPGLPAQNLILEPGPRGTAPCIGLAAAILLLRDPKATMAIFPADHRIADAAGFRQAIRAAAQVAQDGYLVTLGIAPDRPHTGYGYIQRGNPLGRFAGQPAYAVRRFTEKPDEATANRFVDSGEYYWNGGIFIWRADTILEQMAEHLSDLRAALRTVTRAWDTPQRDDVLEKAWQEVPRTTIDYGIMEKAAQVATVPIDVGWDDVGNWSTLSNLLEVDGQGNALQGRGQAVLVDTEGSFVHASDGRLVAVVGLEDFIVVDTADALLVCPQDRAQDVRDVVHALQERGLDRYL